MRYSKVQHVCAHTHALSRVRLFATRQASVHGIFQARIWSGLPFPTPGDFLDPGIKPVFLAFPALAAGFFTTEPPAKPFKKNN